MKLSFFLMERDGRPKQVTTPPNIELEPFILNIIKKEGPVGFIPLIYLKNLKFRLKLKIFNEFRCRAESRFLIIYSHGNASDLGDVYSYAANLSLLYRVYFHLFNNSLFYSDRQI